MEVVANGSYVINTLTKQDFAFVSTETGNVTLSTESQAWAIERAFAPPENTPAYSLTAPFAGKLQVLVQLAPKFDTTTEDHPLAGKLDLIPGETPFLWKIVDEGGKFVISLAPETIPDGVVFPAGGRVYLTADLSTRTAGWTWCGGVEEQIPSSAFWVLGPVSKDGGEIADAAEINP